MAKPVLLAVDDDREVLGAIERDLRRHFSGEYRVLTAASGTEFTLSPPWRLPTLRVARPSTGCGAAPNSYFSSISTARAAL